MTLYYNIFDHNIFFLLKGTPKNSHNQQSSKGVIKHVHNYLKFF